MSEDAMANRGGIQDAKNLEARISGKTAADYAHELLEVTDEWAPAGDIDPSKLAAAIAAAEERGRRRGVEEAAKRVELDCPCHGPRPQSWCKYCRLAVDIRALAPRDSAPVCDCEATLWQGEHSPHCATMQPRDSGKEG